MTSKVVYSIILLILAILLIAATSWISKPLSDKELLEKAEQSIKQKLETLRMNSVEL